MEEKGLGLGLGGRSTINWKHRNVPQVLQEFPCTPGSQKRVVQTFVDGAMWRAKTGLGRVKGSRVRDETTMHPRNGYCGYFSPIKSQQPLLVPKVVVV